MRYLFNRFHEAGEFKELQRDRQKDCRRYADTLAHYVRKDGSKLGSVPLEHITTHVVQRLLETFANGRSATHLQQALPPTPSKANHLYRYLRRTLAWGVRHGYCKENPAMERFSLHGLKQRGVTDSEGNRGDKQDAAGHVSPSTTDRYDHELPVVKPPRRR
ncbi:hypothetical protein XbrCFBP1976_21415 [Xanthomonas bromi]|uniref:Integrase n=1 Tax=Xanthomonas bromi TaxID=56449 RepID=A0ABX5BL47_9XANT|nr:hypothetical protein XbrCFBP1976_21415 [Xanthomonas bromi]